MTDFAMILRSYGEDAVITDGSGTHSEKIFMMPATVRWSGENKYIPSESGIYDTSRYLCFIRGDFDFAGCDGSVICCRGIEYEVLNAELFRVEKENSHWECVVRKRGELFHDGD